MAKMTVHTTSGSKVELESTGDALGLRATLTDALRNASGSISAPHVGGDGHAVVPVRSIDYIDITD